MGQIPVNPIYAAGVAQTDHAARTQAAAQRKARLKPRGDVVDVQVAPVEPASEAGDVEEHAVDGTVQGAVAPPEHTGEDKPRIDISA